jgi:hypothetical protein
LEKSGFYQLNQGFYDISGFESLRFGTFIFSCVPV